MILKSIKDIDREQLNSFSCGINQLDEFFKKHALKNDSNGYGKTFVLEEKNKVVGFFTLCRAQIKFETYPNPTQELLPRYPIPCIRIARLAVLKEKQGKGYGKELLKQAFLKIIGAAISVGVKLVLVDAKETSKSFYEKYGFRLLLNGTLTYYLPLNTIIEAIKG